MKGVSNVAATIPSGRAYQQMCLDEVRGALWMFGGSQDSSLMLNDLWRFDFSSTYWSWVWGQSTGATPSLLYPSGTKNVAVRVCGALLLLLLMCAAAQLGHHTTSSDDTDLLCARRRAALCCVVLCRATGRSDGFSCENGAVV